MDLSRRRFLVAGLSISFPFLTYCLARGEQQPPDAHSSSELHAAFRWSMVPRFGVDRNGDGRTDVPNSHEYVNPQSFAVVLDARTAVGKIASFRWGISGHGVSKVVESSEPILRVDLPRQGTYNVSLTVMGDGGRTARLERDVEVRDLLIVSIGDSYGCGDGAPERPSVHPGAAIWADSPWAVAKRFSSLCGPAMAARALQNETCSTTFVSLASSGASIESGVLARRRGREAVNTDDGLLFGQLDHLERLTGGVGGRRVDALVVSIGGNDLDLEDVLTRLIEHNGASAEKVASIAADIGERRDRLTVSLARLNAEIQRLGIAAESVFICTYPDPLYGANGAEIDHDILEDLARHREKWSGLVSASLDRGEIADAKRHFIRPLNKDLREAAARFGWSLVEMEDLFRTHGYDAPAGERWVNTFRDSMNVQGDDHGTLHPNQAGHAAIGRAIFHAIGSTLVEASKGAHPEVEVKWPAVADAHHYDLHITGSDGSYRVLSCGFSGNDGPPHPEESRFIDHPMLGLRSGVKYVYRISVVGGRFDIGAFPSTGGWEQVWTFEVHKPGAIGWSQ